MVSKGSIQWWAVRASKAFSADLNIRITDLVLIYLSLNVYSIIYNSLFSSFHSFSLGCAVSSSVYLYTDSVICTHHFLCFGILFIFFFFEIAATCQPCTTYLHIPLLYSHAYLNIYVYSILSCTLFYILYFVLYIFFIIINFILCILLCVAFYNICTVHGADLTHISLLVNTFCIIVYVTNKSWTWTLY